MSNCAVENLQNETLYVYEVIRNKVDHQEVIKNRCLIAMIVCRTYRHSVSGEALAAFLETQV